jgi:pyruvate dehydrogenase (quinone)/pyruvate oxidase
MEERGTRQDVPMKPQVVAWELGKRLKDDAIFVSDSGTIATWYARQMPVRANQMCTLSGNLATMANGFPYAIAAQLAFPERQVVALVGDGGFSMLMAELATCVKYKLPVKIIIIKNNTLGQIKWEQMVFLGNPEFGCELEPIHFADLARAFGAAGFTIEDPATCGDLLDQALAIDGPVVVEAVVDPHEPPMPPKITAKQAQRFAESLIKGTPHRGRIALTAVSDRVREMI